MRAFSALLLIGIAAAPAARAGSPVCAPGPFLGPFTTASSMDYGDAIIGEFTGDAFPDVAAADRISNIQVFPGLGDGRLGEPSIATPGLAASFQYGLLAGDFGGSGALDLVIAESGSLAVYRGNGNGTFTLLTRTAAPRLNGFAIAGADLDGDTDPDVVASTDDGVLIFRNLGAGAFDLPIPLSGAQSIVRSLRIADADDDDELDILTTGSGSVSVFLGQGGALFGPAASYLAGDSAQGIAVGDVIGDSSPDILVGVTGYLAILPGVGDGTFLASVLLPSGLGRAVDLVAEDLDGDGHTDFALGGVGIFLGPYTARIGIFRGTPAGLPIRQPSVLLGPRSFNIFDSPGLLQAGDLDLDGDPDLLFSQRHLTTVVNEGEGRFQSGRTARIPVDATFLTADLNGDSRADVVTGGPEIRAGLGRGDGVFEFLPASHDPEHPVFPLRLADFNGDGHVDVVVADGFELRTLLGDGTGQLAQGPGIQITSAFGTGLGGDFNGDGLQDLAIAAPSGASVAVYFGLGDGSLLFAQFLGGVNAAHAASGDLNQDGRTDLVTTNLPTSEVRIFLADATGALAPFLVYSNGLTPGMPVIADLTGEGILDVAFPSFVDGNGVAILPGVGDGTFGEPITVEMTFLMSTIRAGDIDGDDRTDLAVAPQPGGGGAIAVIRSLGGGAFASPETTSFSQALSDFALADLDGRGALGVIALVDGSDRLAGLPSTKLRVARNQEGQTCQPDVRLSVRAGGFGALTYQWRRDAIDLIDGGPVSGANTANLVISPAGPGDAGFYDVVVADSCATVTTPTVWVTEVGGSSPPAPVVSAPASVPPSTANLTASLAPTPGMLYSWFLAGGTITAGQGTSQITFTSGAPGTTMLLQAFQMLPPPPFCSSLDALVPISVDYLDVAVSSPYREFINTLTRHEVTAGCDAGLFCPDSFVTRAQMAIFLIRSRYGPLFRPPAATGTRFLDVSTSTFGAAWIETIAALGVTSGCGFGIYCPDAFVTRAEMAVFLLRMLEGPTYNPPPATGTVFGDVAAGDFAAAWIEEVADRGITSGCGGGNFCPNAFVSRAQMAVFLKTTFDLQ